MGESERDVAIRAVREACAVTRALQDGLTEDWRVKGKADASPVTVGDLAAQAVVGLRLGEPFVGEESATTIEADDQLLEATLAAVRAVRPDVDAGRLLAALRLGEAAPDPAGFWTLDPIDGTKGFLRRAQYCVALARVERGRSVFGVLGCPRLERVPGGRGQGAVAWGAPGRGDARLGSLETPDAETILRLDPGRTDGPVTVAESFEPAHGEAGHGARVVAAAGLVAGLTLRVDSQVKYLLVARGEAQVFCRRAASHRYEAIWDHAAGCAVAEAAGVVVTDLDGAPFDFGRGRHLERNRGVLAASPGLHARLLEASARIERSA